ncbi:unnamed protein product [Arabidopsis lyrata]|nr:unnamed protein product [Arabidopsis lyrata]
MVRIPEEKPSAARGKDLGWWSILMVASFAKLMSVEQYAGFTEALFSAEF